MARWGRPKRWTLRWNGQSFDFSMTDERQGIAFDLRTEPSKDLVLQGPNGFSRKGDEPGAASLYYSFTRLATEGTAPHWGRKLSGSRRELDGQGVLVFSACGGAAGLGLV